MQKDKLPQCWIYFQGEARAFARRLRNEMNKRKQNLCAIDENFQDIFPLVKDITEGVRNSINLLTEQQNGIAVIVFTKDFFKDGEKNLYNPTDEFQLLINCHKLQKLILVPIWYGINPIDVLVPINLRSQYDYVTNVIGHFKVADS